MKETKQTADLGSSEFKQIFTEYFSEYFEMDCPTPMNKVLGVDKHQNVYLLIWSDEGNGISIFPLTFYSQPIGKVKSLTEGIVRSFMTCNDYKADGEAPDLIAECEYADDGHPTIKYYWVSKQIEPIHLSMEECLLYTAMYIYPSILERVELDGFWGETEIVRRIATELIDYALKKDVSYFDECPITELVDEFAQIALERCDKGEYDEFVYQHKRDEE